jgi:hypothetical protein
MGKLLFEPDAREMFDYAEWALKTFPPALERSEDPHLAGQEMRQVAIGDAANSFETMVIEATKPSDRTHRAGTR